MSSSTWLGCDDVVMVTEASSRVMDCLEMNIMAWRPYKREINLHAMFREIGKHNDKMKGQTKGKSSWVFQKARCETRSTRSTKQRAFSIYILDVVQIIVFVSSVHYEIMHTKSTVKM